MLFLGVGVTMTVPAEPGREGSVLAARRITDGLAGVGELHALVAAPTEQPRQVAVGIETDRGLLVGALLTAGYQV